MLADQVPALQFSRRLSLTARILALNIFALVMLAGSLFYLNNYRDRLTDERLAQASRNAALVALALPRIDESARAAYVAQAARRTGTRLRVYDRTGEKTLDSFDLAPPTYRFIDPDEQPLRKDLARALDRSIERLVGSDPIRAYREPALDRADGWPLLRRLDGARGAVNAVRLAPDRTPVLMAAAKSPEGASVLLTDNARGISRIVRAERTDVMLVVLFVIAASTLLSLFLARTIVRPIRRLARAAVRVRLGREPEAAVPRMPERRDEIGQLARALSDMSQALRDRIDATDAFAADVSHEIKNPLASLRSALDGLDTVKEPALRAQLLDIAKDDVRRIDRLVGDIAEAGRMDATIARTHFEPIDIGAMLDGILLAREERMVGVGAPSDEPQIAFARPSRGVARVMGDAGGLARAFENCLDNALSFAPPKSLIEISAAPDRYDVVVTIADQGPGIAPEHRETVFDRFHSDRPDSHGFGRHSGLGLAISRAIIEAHDGTIRATDRPDGGIGACFRIRLPRSAP